jgi:transposase
MKDITQPIRKEFRRSEEAKYIHRLHGVLLVLLGLSTVKAGELLGVPQRTIAHWAVRYKTLGVSGLRDPARIRRRYKLTDEQQNRIAGLLARKPAEAGMGEGAWTGALLAEYLSKTFEIEYTPRHCTRLIRSLRGRPRA